MGDFYTHEKIGEVIGKTSAVVDSSHLDDSGLYELVGSILWLRFDGMHSAFQIFLSLQDSMSPAQHFVMYMLMVRGLCLRMLSDIHIADDGDVRKDLRPYRWNHYSFQN